MVDRKDGAYFLRINSSWQLVIYDNSLSDLNSDFEAITFIGSTPRSVASLQDNIHCSVGTLKEVRIYKVESSITLENTFTLDLDTISVSETAESTFVLALDISYLYFFDWKNGIAKEWSKLLPLTLQLVKGYPLSNNFILIGFSGATETGGLLGYDRNLDQIFLQESTG